MDGLVGFKQIFSFLVAQAVLLVACAAYLSYVAINHSDRLDLAVASAFTLVFSACSLLVLRYAWPIGTSGVELFWGTSIKLHVERLMQPALALGAIAMLLAAAEFVAFGDTFLTRVSVLALAAGAIAAPLAISVLLMVSASRRLRAYRRSLEIMTENLQSGPAPVRAGVSVNSEAGLTDTTVRPSPQGFTFAGLTSKPWHEAQDFPWIKAFEQAVDEINAEFEALAKIHGEDFQTYKYAGLHGDYWQSFQFVTRHRVIPENLALCPKTAALLKSIPHYPSFRDAMFSILAGGGVIQPHRDVSNVFLTMHLPLITTGKGSIEVGGLRREWRRGEAMIFDSSYQHKAQNNSDQARVVLLVDFLHPDLTPEEAAWVTASRI
jgi:aspartyl/asparaginyl beta-hydroxylase (cupin superfamily)